MKLIRSYHGKGGRKSAPSAYIDPAVIIGDVTIGEHANVWPGTVIQRRYWIRIGARSNIQDGDPARDEDQYPLIIDENVTVGHGVI